MVLILLRSVFLRTSVLVELMYCLRLSKTDARSKFKKEKAACSLFLATFPLCISCRTLKTC